MKMTIDCKLQIDRATMKAIRERGDRIRAEFVESATNIHCYDNRITVFGSARTEVGTREYEQIRMVSQMLSENGYTIVCGGGPGIMQAGAEGTKCEGCGISVGVGIELPFETSINEYVDTAFVHDKFYLRKLVMVDGAKGFIVGPGGFGTMDELFEVLTLIQTEKTPQVPIVLVGSDFWNPMIPFIETMLRYETISPEDPDLFVILDEPEEIVDYIMSWSK